MATWAAEPHEINTAFTQYHIYQLVIILGSLNRMIIGGLNSPNPPWWSLIIHGAAMEIAYKLEPPPPLDSPPASELSILAGPFYFPGERYDGLAR